jgi:acetylornithine deacetylase
MLCGHTDTVGVSGMADPFGAHQRGERLYGRGAQDMKGGVAAMIGAARTIVDAGGLGTGRVIVAAVVDEEHASLGADALVREWRADAAVVTEPTALEIAVAHKGFAWVEVHVHGRAAHGSRPAEGQDAILRMGRVLGHLEALDRSLQRQPPHPMVGTASLHASSIQGGGELSSYPAHAMLRVERRTLPGESEGAALAEVQQILDGLRLDDATFRAEARTLFARRGYELAADHALPQMLAASLQRVAPARAPAIVGASFWTDAAILAHAGIPSVLFGPGGAGLHSDEEYVELEDVRVCRETLVDLVRNFC